MEGVDSYEPFHMAFVILRLHLITEINTQSAMTAFDNTQSTMSQLILSDKETLASFSCHPAMASSPSL